MLFLEPIEYFIYVIYRLKKKLLMFIYRKVIGLNLPWFITIVFSFNAFYLLTVKNLGRNIQWNTLCMNN